MRSRRRRASVCWIPGLLLTIAAAAPAQEALVLHVLDCGTMSGIETEAFLPGVEDRPKRFDMVNRCFLVVHPQGTLLWDGTGLASGVFLYQLKAGTQVVTRKMVLTR